MPQSLDVSAEDRGEHGDWTGTRWNPYLREASVDGRRMRYLDVGSGPTVLLVHGLGASWEVWYRNIAALSADHRVLAVDLPGFGRSETLHRATGIGGFAAALARLLDRVAVDRALVVGHSLGGLVAQRLAVGHPGRVTGLVIVCSGDGIVDIRQQLTFRSMALVSALLKVCGPPAAVLDPALRAILSIAPLRRGVLSRVVHDPGRVPPELAAVMVASVLRSPALADAILAGLHGELDPRGIACPTLILAGRQDRLVPAPAGRRLAAAIPAARYEVWPDVGHHPMLERAAAFDDRVRAFSRDVHGLTGSPDARA